METIGICTLKNNLLLVAPRFEATKSILLLIFSKAASIGLKATEKNLTKYANKRIIIELDINKPMSKLKY